ncbi:chaperone protein DnaJ [Strigomonas culicis]|uniref:Chaperone protein DnaJ n=1 Tax=Strigomonas culicis TaxID=28005 RepID=S9V0N7_9TRYP|nr:chaperone protein DnaJ [Strigomonas culicis]|eukprot:EPY20476.1 chaperone protein DnaJ [Strigomonas culicis]
MQASRLLCIGLRRVPAAVGGGVGAYGALPALSLSGAALLCHARFASTKNPYTVLGIKQGATKQEIKKAYRVTARKHHPDAPGGNHEKFQEIQEAYDQVKSGVWIRKNAEGGAAGGDGGGSGNTNRYSGFRYTTRTHQKSKVSYDEFYTEMHTGKVKKDPFADDDEEEGGARADPRKNPFAMNEIAFEAWLRFIVMWCVLFMTLRVVLFLIFPPNWEKPQRKPPPKEIRKRPPPPKPLGAREGALVS